MADEIRVNGVAFSWGSIIAKAGGERFHGFNMIEYQDKLERVKGYGMGRHQAPRSRSRGKYTVEPVKIGGPKASLQTLRKKLADMSSDGRSYGTVEFEFVVEFVDTGESPQIVVIERCVWAVDGSSHSEGADLLEDTAEFDAMLIRRNGFTLFDSSQGSP